MYNSEGIISYSATICSLVGVFRSLNYLQDLSSASLLGHAVQKFPPNMKEAWSMHTVKRTMDRPAHTNTFMHGAERIFTKNTVSSNKVKLETTGCISTTTNGGKPEESSGMPFVTDVKGLLQVTEVELQAHGKSKKVLSLCDSACGHSWISANLAKRRNVDGKPTKLTVHGTNVNQVVDKQLVELKLTPVH